MKGTIKEFSKVLNIEDQNISRGVIHFLTDCGALKEIGHVEKVPGVKGRTAVIYETQPEAQEKIIEALKGVLNHV